MANEKRLIDANALLKKMQFRLPINDKISEVIAECVNIAVRCIKNAPTVDAVEVVRCKDCKHRYTASSGVIFCTQHLTMSAKDDDFCSYGERRNDG